MSAPGRAEGLSAREIGDLAAELGPALRGAVLREVVGLGDTGLRLALEAAEGKRFEVVASWRAGLSRFHCRFRAPRIPDPPPSAPARVLAGLVEGCAVAGLAPIPNDRAIVLRLAARAEELALRIELFGPRSRWVLVGPDGRVRALSEPLAGARRLAVGEPDSPPTPPPSRAQSQLSRLPPAGAAFEAHRAAEALFAELDEAERAETLRAEISSALRARLRSRAARVAGLRSRLEEAKGAGDLRRSADLLSASRAAIPRGASEARVTNYFDPALAEVAIPLDPAADLATQITRLYDRARRLEAGAARTGEEIAFAERESEALGAALAAAETAPDRGALESLRVALAERRLLAPSPRARAPRKSEEPAEDFRRFQSADGLEILVGKGDRENDALTFRVARGGDLWLHAGLGAAGSHVIVRLARGKSVPLETLLDAATLAIHFSKLRGTGRAEVLYAARKLVSKPRGARPGSVTVAGERRLLVDFDRARLDRLLAGGRPDLAIPS